MKTLLTKSQKFEIMEKYSLIICKYFNITKEELIGTCRRREFVIPRQLLFYTIRSYNKQSITLKEIARFSGNRHHATIIHGIDTVKDQSEYDWFKEPLTHIKKQLEPYFELDVA